MSKVDLEERVSILENKIYWYEKYNKIQMCPYCQHGTLQTYNYKAAWVCLTCGNMLEYGMLLREK